MGIPRRENTTVGRYEVGIHAVNALYLDGGQIRPAGRGAVLSIPRVAYELKRLRGRMRPDVDKDANLISAEYHKIPLESAVAAGCETRLGRFLKNPQNPLAGLIDRIVSDCRSVDTNKRDGRFAPNKDTPLHGYILGLIGNSLWAKIG
jgi:hypothetical protein